jgi:hypothetical protein
MDVAYEAEHTNLGRHVGLKLLHAELARDSQALEWFRRDARAAYRDLLTLWKNADPDIPVLVAAQSEHARLK